MKALGMNEPWALLPDTQLPEGELAPAAHLVA